MDQLQVDITKDRDSVMKKKNLPAYKLDGEHTVIQLHRWFGNAGEYLVGDWAVVEWLRVRKGEQIGKAEMVVEVPTWNKGKGGFEIRSTPEQGPKGKAVLSSSSPAASERGVRAY